MSAPLALVSGATAAVAGVLVEQPAVTAAGAAAIGTTGLLHRLRQRSRERRLNERRSRALTAPIPSLVWHSPVDEPVVEDVTAPIRPYVAPLPAPAAAPAEDVDTRVDTRIDTGELQRIWDLGEGPDTGPLPVVPDAPIVADGRLVTEAPAGKQAVLLVGLEGTGTTQVLAPVLARRPRAGTADARVFDAIAWDEADELTRMLKLASGRGRRAATSPVDAQPRALPAGTSSTRPVAVPQEVPAVRGRHSAA